MEKTAKKGEQGILNKLREMTNISGIAAEKFFNPEFKKVMESLRAKDDQIRSLVVGSPIGAGDPGEEAISLKQLLKESKSNLNRREYMSAIADLSLFHKKLLDVTQQIGKLEQDVDAVHHEFLFKDLGDKQKQRLHSLKTRFARRQQLELIKEGGIVDFLKNIGTPRGRALAAWEKRYPKQVGKLRDDANRLQTKSEGILAQVISSLKEMATARATRNIDDYVKSADKITKVYQAYDKSFKEFYATNVKGFLDKIDLVIPVPAPDAAQLGKQDVPVEGLPKTDQVGPLPQVFDGAPAGVKPSVVSPVSPTVFSPGMGPIPPRGSPFPILNQPPLAGPPFAPVDNFPPTVVTGPPDMPEDTIPETKRSVMAHKKFLASLESLSSENPILLAAYIAKYARSIQATDPSTSIQLFKIANKIRG